MDTYRLYVWVPQFDRYYVTIHRQFVRDDGVDCSERVGQTATFAKREIAIRQAQVQVEGDARGRGNLEFNISLLG